MPLARNNPVLRRQELQRATALAVRAATPAGAIALRQGFTLLHSQARDAGLSDADIRRLTRRGTWSVPRRAVLSVLPRPASEREAGLHGQSPEVRAAAAALVRRDAVISHECAALARGIQVLLSPRLATLTTCGRRYAGARGDAVVHAAWLDEDETATWFGVPITTPARTVVDIARTGMRPGLVAVESALCWGLVTHDELDATIARQHHWDGVKTARRVLELAGDGSESPLESLTRLFLHDCEIPLPRQQAEIETFLGSFWVDGVWDEERVVLEVDGMLKYRRTSDHDDPLGREKVRQEAIADAGYEVIRVTWEDIHRWPERTAARIRRVLARRDPARGSLGPDMLPRNARNGA